MKQHQQQNQQQQGANRDRSMNDRSTDQGDVTDMNRDAGQRELDRSEMDEDMPV